MIIKCPNCSFEQPLEGDYCPSCGGELQLLLKKEKQRKIKEQLKSKILLATLSFVLVAGYVLIFYTKNSQTKVNEFEAEVPIAQTDKPLKLSPSKIVSRSAAPPKKEIPSKPKINESKKKKNVVSAAAIKTSKTETLAKIPPENEKTDDLVKKNIQNIKLLDRLNCEDTEVKVILNDVETKNLVDCSQVVVSDIETKETFVLEEDEATVSMSLYLTETALEVIMTVIMEGDPLSYNYFFNLPQTKESTASVVFPIQLKSPSSDLEKALENSTVLPLFFKDKDAEDLQNWSPLFFHATF